MELKRAPDDATETLITLVTPAGVTRTFEHHDHLAQREWTRGRCRLYMNAMPRRAMPVLVDHAIHDAAALAAMGLQHDRVGARSGECNANELGSIVGRIARAPSGRPVTLRAKRLIEAA